MKKITLALFAFAISISFIHAQLSIQWQNSLGGSAGDWGQSVCATADSGYIVAGYSLSSNGDVTSNYGNDDFWVVKLNSAGNIQWQTTLGGSGYDQAYSIQQTADTGYVVAGFTASNDSDVSGNHGSDDFWIVKLNSAGNIQWQTCLGGTALDDAFTIQQTDDGGYIISGDTQSNDGDVSGNHGNFDSWIVKLDSAGNIQWKKCFGGTGDDTAASIQQTNDNGYIVGGSSNSTDGDVSGNHGGFDFWIVKLDSAGSIQWQKCLGGTGEDTGYSIQQTTDSGYVFVGFTRSTNGDVTGIHGTGTQPDYWVVKLDTAGNIQWQKCLGGTGDDKAYSVDLTADTGYVVAGYTRSNSGDVTGNHMTGTQDYWIVKLNSAGNIQWQQCFGGTSNDWARSIQQTADSEYVVAGFAASINGDVSGNNGSNDFWVVKLAELTTGIKEKQNAATWSIFPNPTNGIFSVSGDLPVKNGILKIVNPLGQVIFQSQFSNEKTQVDLSACSAGIYFVVISDEDQEWTGKIIID